MSPHSRRWGAAAFAFDLLLAFVGLLLLLLPTQVRALLQGLWLLLKVAMNGPVIADLLDLAANAIDTGGLVLAGPVIGPLNPASTILTDAGQA